MENRINHIIAVLTIILVMSLSTADGSSQTISNDYINVERLDEKNAVVYCNSDTIYVVVATKEELSKHILATIAKIDCR